MGWIGSGRETSATCRNGTPQVQSFTVKIRCSTRDPRGQDPECRVREAAVASPDRVFVPRVDVFLSYT